MACLFLLEICWRNCFYCFWFEFEFEFYAHLAWFFQSSITWLFLGHCGLSGENNFGDDRVLCYQGQMWLHHIMLTLFALKRISIYVSGTFVRFLSYDGWETIRAPPMVVWRRLGKDFTIGEEGLEHQPLEVS